MNRIKIVSSQPSPATLTRSITEIWRSTEADVIIIERDGEPVAKYRCSDGELFFRDDAPITIGNQSEGMSEPGFIAIGIGSGPKAVDA